MSVRLRFPLVLEETENGDLSFYDDVESLVRDVEPSEVLSKAYRVWDAQGRPGHLAVFRAPQSLYDRVSFTVATDVPERVAELEGVLREFLLSQGYAQAPSLSIEDLIREARVASTALRKQSTPWYLR